MMAGTGRALGGALLIAAGIYQWLPIKDSCLTQCRAPLSFVQRHGGFQPSARGSVRLGVLHGLYCIGCCWVLMALLFAFGVMNLLWIAGLMVFVLRGEGGAVSARCVAARGPGRDCRRDRVDACAEE